MPEVTDRLCLSLGFFFLYFFFFFTFSLCFVCFFFFATTFKVRCYVMQTEILDLFRVKQELKEGVSTRQFHLSQFIKTLSVPELMRSLHPEKNSVSLLVFRVLLEARELFSPLGGSLKIILQKINILFLRGIPYFYFQIKIPH